MLSNIFSRKNTSLTFLQQKPLKNVYKSIENF